jgi:hypothetical protein
VKVPTLSSCWFSFSSVVWAATFWLIGMSGSASAPGTPTTDAVNAAAATPISAAARRSFAVVGMGNLLVVSIACERQDGVPGRASPAGTGASARGLV